MSEKELINPIIVDILTKLKEEPNRRYTDLREHLKISDATLSKKMKLLQTYLIIQADSTNNKSSRNFIIYSLTDKGKKMQSLITNYLRAIHIQPKVEDENNV